MDIDNDIRGNRFKSMNEIEKEHRIFQNYVVKCKCSHTILFTGVKDRLLCTYCGRYVYRDKKTEMKYKLKELLWKRKEVKDIMLRKW